MLFSKGFKNALNRVWLKGFGGAGFSLWGGLVLAGTKTHRLKPAPLNPFSQTQFNAFLILFEKSMQTAIPKKPAI